MDSILLLVLITAAAFSIASLCSKSQPSSRYFLIRFELTTTTGRNYGGSITCMHVGSHYPRRSYLVARIKQAYPGIEADPASVAILNIIEFNKRDYENYNAA